MTQPYMVVNVHKPEDCEPMDAGLSHLSPRLKGKDFYCTCPGGQHGFFMIVEGDSADDVIETLPPEWRPGSTALALEIFHT